MDKGKKGLNTEKKCANELKGQGYTVWKTMRVRFANIDLWGLFDVVAVHPEGEHILFIQCKTNALPSPAQRQAIRALKLPENCEKWAWIWYDRKGWRKVKLFGEDVYLEEEDIPNPRGICLPIKKL